MMATVEVRVMRSRPLGMRGRAWTAGLSRPIGGGLRAAFTMMELGFRTPYVVFVIGTAILISGWRQAI